MIGNTRRFGLQSVLILATSFFMAAAPASAEMPPEIPLEVFAQLPQVMSPRLSPDGTYLAMIRPYKGLRHLFIEPLSGEGKQAVIPPIGQFQIKWAEWANNERILVGISFEGWRNGIPAAESRMIAVGRDGSNVRNIVQPKKDQEPNTRLGRSDHIAQFQDRVVDFLRHDPDHFLLSIDSDSDDAYEIRRINIQSGNYIEPYGELRGVQHWVTDQQGEVRLAHGAETISALGTGRTRKQFLYYRHADGRFSDFTEAAIHRQGFRIRGFAKDPDHVFLSGPGDNGLEIMIRYDMRTEAVLETYEHDEFDATDLIYDGVGEQPIGIRFAGGSDSNYFNSEWSKRYRAINKALPDTINTVTSSNSSNSLHLIHSVSDTDPGSYYFYDEGTKSMRRLATLYKGMDPVNTAPMKRISYKARDGLTISAILTLPQGSDGKNLPSIILPHGGPHVTDEATFDYRVQFLANRGYAVLQPNFRGSSGYGPAFLKAGYQQWGLKMQDDVTDGTKWLIDQGIADPDRICIAGALYGGYSALMGTIKEPGLYACAISLNAITDIGSYISTKEKFVGGAVSTRHINQKNQKSVSPLRHAKAINVPVLLIATKDAIDVPYKHSKRMAKALKRVGQEHKYVEIKEGNDDLVTEEARTIFLAETEAFLAKHIGRGR